MWPGVFAFLQKSFILPEDTVAANSKAGMLTPVLHTYVHGPNLPATLGHICN